MCINRKLYVTKGKERKGREGREGGRARERDTLRRKEGGATWSEGFLVLILDT